MGMFKGMKDMRDMLGAAPGLVDQANQLSANAQAMSQQGQASAYGAQVAPPAPPAAPLPANLAEPIAGVDLATFAQVSAGLAAYEYDQSRAVDIAAERGISSTDWTAAVEGWNARIAGHPAVARQFNALYTGRA